jgi:capsular polysaccharide export protein
LYDIDGLTCRGTTLDEFWHFRKAPDKNLFKKFRSYLIQHTQLNGSFYGRFPTEWVQSKDSSLPVLSSHLKPLSLNR